MIPETAQVGHSTAPVLANKGRYQASRRRKLCLGRQTVAYAVIVRRFLSNRRQKDRGALSPRKLSAHSGNEQGCIERVPPRSALRALLPDDGGSRGEAARIGGLQTVPDWVLAFNAEERPAW